MFRVTELERKKNSDMLIIITITTTTTSNSCRWDGVEERVSEVHGLI